VLDVLKPVPLSGERNLDNFDPTARLPQRRVQVGQIANGEENHPALLPDGAIGCEAEQRY
jgi:hypothetical protein